MTRRSTEQVITDLAQALPPVHPIPRLRGVLLVLLATWLLVSAGMFAVAPAMRAALGAIPWGDPHFFAILTGLVLIAAGGAPSAFAGAVPGRDGIARVGAGVTAVGVAFAAGGGLWALTGAPSVGVPDLAGGAACLGKASGLALLPVAVAAFFLARGVAAHPLFNAGLAVTASVALGAAAVHVGCRAGGAFHVLLGHALAPMLLGAALAFPVGALVRRLARRS